MTAAPIVVVFGVGLGLLLLGSQISSPRRSSGSDLSVEQLRDQAIEAQIASARASARARELADRWSAAIAEESHL
jgi:hypothetical protein